MYANQAGQYPRRLRGSSCFITSKIEVRGADHLPQFDTYLIHVGKKICALIAVSLHSIRKGLNHFEKRRPVKKNKMKPTNLNADTYVERESNTCLAGHSCLTLLLRDTFT